MEQRGKNPGDYCVHTSRIKNPIATVDVLYLTVWDGSAYAHRNIQAVEKYTVYMQEEYLSKPLMAEKEFGVALLKILVPRLPLGVSFAPRVPLRTARALT